MAKGVKLALRSQFIISAIAMSPAMKDRLAESKISVPRVILSSFRALRPPIVPAPLIATMPSRSE